jgi:hypothetical protein
MANCIEGCVAKYSSKGMDGLHSRGIDGVVGNAAACYDNSLDSNLDIVQKPLNGRHT